MTLFELQQWLGHPSPAAIQHHAKITLLKFAKSYADGGYFVRNLRAIEAHLLRSLQEIPLGDAEPAAVEDGVAAYENLLPKLADVSTPAGPTPRQIGAELVQITSLRQSVMPVAQDCEAQVCR
jgi:hypothetical protein